MDGLLRKIGDALKIHRVVHDLPRPPLDPNEPDLYAARSILA
jgi:hypothetical protein